MCTPYKKKPLKTHRFPEKKHFRHPTPRSHITTKTEIPPKTRANPKSPTQRPLKKNLSPHMNIFAHTHCEFRKGKVGELSRPAGVQLVRQSFKLTHLLAVDARQQQVADGRQSHRGRVCRAFGAMAGNGAFMVSAGERRERQHSPASASRARLRRREWRMSGAQRACAKNANTHPPNGQCAFFEMSVGVL